MLSRPTILMAFEQLSDELGKQGVLGELNVVGGTAIVLAFNARSSTKDADAIFEPASDVRSAAAVVAENLALSEDWLNDAAPGSELRDANELMNIVSRYYDPSRILPRSNYLVDEILEEIRSS